MVAGTVILIKWHPDFARRFSSSYQSTLWEEKKERKREEGREGENAKGGPRSWG